jgi:GntR family transcriptional regulator
MTVRSPSLPIGPISPAAPGPLYQQIVEALKREVASGRLPPGRPLPSFRALAEELQVSLITVKRAYEELERDGVIYRRQGLGTFIADNGAAAARQAQQTLARQAMRHAVALGREGGLGDAELVRLLQEALDLDRGVRG